MAHRTTLEFQTPGRGTLEITREVQAAIAESGIREGVATLFLHHTSASLVLCENADPDVRADLERYFARLAPDGDPMFEHDAEGPDDMPAHVRSILTGTSLQLPVAGGCADLGTWQGIYLWEHRTQPHRRRVSVTVLD